MRNLSDRQKKILQIIADFIAKHRFPPTMQELADELGIRSKNAIFKHLASLEKKGYINRGTKGASRNITLTHEPQTKVLPVVRSGSVGLKEFLEGLPK